MGIAFGDNSDHPRVGDIIKYVGMLPGGVETGLAKEGKIVEILSGEEAKKLGDFIVELPDGRRESVTKRRLIYE